MVKVFNVIVSYLKIARPLNTAIAGCAVLLGMWLTGFASPAACGGDGAGFILDAVVRNAASVVGYAALLNLWLTGFASFAAYIGYAEELIPDAVVCNAALLMLAAMFATAYGNAVNDVLDVETDRVSHPGRPLVTGAVGVRAAAVFAAALGALSLVCAAAASLFHAAAALVPLTLLTMYSIYFKRTRIAGNILVAALTAYALLFGGLPHPNTKILFAPALLAFLLNFCRELLKDVQDAEGDKAAGFTTSADLRRPVIRLLLIFAGAVHLAAMWAPSLVLGDFGAIYTGVCAAAVLPLHVSWMRLAFRADFDKHAAQMASILKAEMLAGLSALAADKFILTL